MAYDLYDDFNPDIKYKKKKIKKSNKSNHKHCYTPCVFEYNDVRFDKAQGFKYDVPAWEIGGYCPICGKIGFCEEQYDYVNAIYVERLKRLKLEIYYLHPEDFYNDKAKKEFNPKTRTIPCFFISDIYSQKFVNIS